MDFWLDTSMFTPEFFAQVLKDAEIYQAQEQQKSTDLANLKSQILNQWKQLGVPSIGGGLSIEDRAQGLAERLYANQITDLKNLGMGSAKVSSPYEAYLGEGGEGPIYETRYTDTPQNYLTYDGRQIGFLGDIGTAENWQPTGYLQPGNLASWGAQGKGAVSYTVQQAPNGQVYFVPSWGSTSDVSTIMPIVSLGLGLLAPGVGTAIGSALGATGAAATALGNAIIGGTLAEASGGDFAQGALAGGAGALAGGYIAPEISSAIGSDVAGKAITSGLLSEAQGGDFLSGVTSGAISGLANEAKLAAAEEYLASQPSGFGSYESNLPTEQDVLNVIAAEQPTYTVSDTSFTPDYSLTTGAPVIQEMGAQGIQVPTINEIVDVVNQPVDYSLPIPESGLGLTMPTAPNIESMGGGQGITVPVAGGTLTESGVIPETYIPVLGDETSFINQPAPESGVTVTEPKETPMTQEELTNKLAGVDLAKTAANLAAGALTAGAVANLAGGDNTQTGYEIVPVPSDWQSPTYAQLNWNAPAPIDFGSRELLKGTQWENPITLSSLINSMNAQSAYQMPDFMQSFNAPSTVGVNDIVGNLGGKPMSITDIIAGIQNGQTYSS